MNNYENLSFKNKLNLVKQTWIKRYVTHPKQVKEFLLRAKLQTNKVVLINDAVLTSYQMNDLLGHHQYRIGELTSISSLLLENQKDRLSYLMSQLESTVSTRKSLDASIGELQVQKYRHYNYVHHNKFVRPQDLINKSFVTSMVSNRFIKDELNYIYDYGLSLPIKRSHPISMKEIALNYTSSSMGDTIPIQMDSPENLMDGKVFNYKIRRVVKDEKNQKVKRVAMKLALDFALHGSQRVNWIEIRSAAPQSLTIESIASISANGEKTQFISDALTFRDKIIIQLEPIAASKIEIIFSTKSYVSLSEVGELIYEEYDLSLLDVKFAYNVFNETGYFVSKDIEMKNPTSFKLDYLVSNPQILNLTIDYGDKFSLSEDLGFIEAQLELSNDSTRILLPMPINKISTQILKLNNQYSKLQFLPDIYAASKKYYCTSVDQDRFVTDITLSFNHGYETGTSFNQDAELFLGINNTSILTKRWEILGDKTIRLHHSLSTPSTISGQHMPGALFVVYDYKGFTINQGYLNLSIGDDYRLSLDAGKTWYTSMPSYSEVQKIYQTSIAGNCLIDIISKSVGSTYWTQYTIQNEQSVLPNGLAIIKHDKVVLDSKLQLHNCKGNVRLILDSDKILPELSPVITQYELKVRSHANSKKTIRKDTITRK